MVRLQREHPSTLQTVYDFVSSHVRKGWESPLESFYKDTRPIPVGSTLMTCIISQRLPMLCDLGGWDLSM
jgi:hypothetical protein